MATFRAYFKKEWFSIIREYKLLIFGAIALFFTFSDPLMLYFTPVILESQVGSGVDLSALFETSQRISVQNLTGDLYQILGIVVLIFSANLIINEYKKGKIVIPYSNGMNASMMVFAKYFMYTLVVNTIIIISIVISHYYSGLVFNDFSLKISDTLLSALGFIVFLNYNIALIFLVSSFKQSKFLAISIGLMNYLALPSLLNLFKFIRISPYRVMEALSMPPINTTLVLSFVVAICTSFVMLIISMMKLREYPSS